MNGFLYYQNIWLVYGVTIALFAGAAALGSWLGRRPDVHADDKAASQFNAIQGAILCTSAVSPHRTGFARVAGRQSWRRRYGSCG